MPDEWSSSVATLTGRGDWIRWDFTIPDGATADDFNGDPDFTRSYLAIRLGMTAASRSAIIVVIINDTIALNLSGGFVSSSGSWVSANRFLFDERSVTPGFRVTDASLAGTPFTVLGLAPFVVGTNTIRLLSLGRNPDAADEPIEVDFMFLDTGSVPDLARFGVAVGTDAAAETAPAAFATHVNGNPFSSPQDDHGWLLKAPSGTTGTAGMPTLRVLRFCPSTAGNITAILKITDGTNPVSGLVGVYDQTAVTVQTATLVGGKAEFTFPDTSDIVFWYAGTDDWMPLSVRLEDGYRVGCNGWHVGRIGVG